MKAKCRLRRHDKSVSPLSWGSSIASRFSVRVVSIHDQEHLFFLVWFYRTNKMFQPVCKHFACNPDTFGSRKLSPSWDTITEFTLESLTLVNQCGWNGHTHTHTADACCSRAPLFLVIATTWCLPGRARIFWGFWTVDKAVSSMLKSQLLSNLFLSIISVRTLKNSVTFPLENPLTLAIGVDSGWRRDTSPCRERNPYCTLPFAFLCWSAEEYFIYSATRKAKRCR